MNKKYILLISSLTLAALATAACLVLILRKKKTETDRINTEDRQVTQETDAEIEQPSQATSTADVPWRKYRNNEWGIAFDYPERALAYDLYNDGNYDTCENPQDNENVLVPYNVFVQNNELLLKESYYYEINESGACVKTPNTLSKIKQQEQGEGNWHIYIENVANEKELGEVIRRWYEEGCILDQLEETAHKGTYDVVLENDGKDLGESACFINAIVHMKYSPKQGKVAYWLIGQECTKSATDYDINTCLDRAIADSFRFTNSVQSPPSVPEGKSTEWKTYTNDQYGFTIKYPSERIVQTNSGYCSICDFDIEFYTKGEWAILNDPGPHPGPSIVVYIYSNKYNHISLVDWYRDTFDSPPLRFTPFTSTYITGFEIIGQGAYPDAEYKEAFFVIGDTVFSINAESEIHLEQILSTFQPTR